MTGRWLGCILPLSALRACVQRQVLTPAQGAQSCLPRHAAASRWLFLWSPRSPLRPPQNPPGPLTSPSSGTWSGLHGTHSKHVLTTQRSHFQTCMPPAGAGRPPGPQCGKWHPRPCQCLQLGVAPGGRDQAVGEQASGSPGSPLWVPLSSLEALFYRRCLIGITWGQGPSTPLHCS